MAASASAGRIGTDVEERPAPFGRKPRRFQGSCERGTGATSASFCNFSHVVPEVWEILLVVWIVVIPASVALLTALAARRRAARLRGSVYGAMDQPGRLTRLAVHARRLEQLKPPAARRRLGDSAG